MIQITMPKAGQSMEDGTIVRWLKAEGQNVAKGEILLEVETDKAVIEVESTDTGTLRKVLVGEGQTVPVHTPIALLGRPDEQVPASATPTPAAQAPAASAAPVATPPVAAAPPGQAPPKGVIPVVMPKAGQSVEEATLVKWRIQPGAKVAVGEIVFEIETDKAVVEVEATDSGRLSRIVVPEGQTVPVLTPVAYLGDDDKAVEAYIASQGVAPVAAPAGKVPTAPPAAQPVAAAAPSAAPVTESGRVRASPAARKAAQDRRIDLAGMGAGSGPGRRIVLADLARAPAVRPAAAPTARPAPAAPAAPHGEPVRRRMTPMRRAIARNLLASKQTIPHFYTRLTIDADPMYTFYRAEKAKYPCTVNDVVALACARAIREFPAFRSRLDGEEIVEFPAANVGIAVGLEAGLVVPVLVGADSMGLQQLAAASKRIAEAARNGRIEGLGQGVFTITNLGMFGVEEFAGIINPPEAALLAVGAIREAVIARDGMLRPGRVMTLTLSADHRVIDGVLAAKFLARLKELLEAPQLMQG